MPVTSPLRRKREVYAMISISRVISGEVKADGHVCRTDLPNSPGATPITYDVEDYMYDGDDDGNASIFTGVFPDYSGDDDDPGDQVDEEETNHPETKVAAHVTFAIPDEEGHNGEVKNDMAVQKKHNQKDGTMPSKVLPPAAAAAAAASSEKIKRGMTSLKATTTTTTTTITEPTESVSSMEDESPVKVEKQDKITEGKVAITFVQFSKRRKYSKKYQKKGFKSKTFQSKTRQTSLGFDEPPNVLTDIEEGTSRSFDTAEISDVESRCRSSLDVVDTSTSSPLVEGVPSSSSPTTTTTTSKRRRRAEMGPEKTPFNLYRMIGFVVVVALCIALISIFASRNEEEGVDRVEGLETASLLAGSHCQNSILLASGVPSRLLDSTIQVIQDESDRNILPIESLKLPHCGEVHTTNNGPGRFYKIMGDGKVYRASTCSEKTDFDTQLTVFANDAGESSSAVSSCESLICIDTNDNYCGDQSEVTWFAELGIEYVIYVTGYRSQMGVFELLVEPVIKWNDQCETSIVLDPFVHHRFGSTKSLEPPPLNFVSNGDDGDNNIPTCTEGVTTTSGLWYTWIGTGRTVVFSTCNNARTDYNAQLSIFSPGMEDQTCGGDLQCVPNMMNLSEQCGNTAGQMVQFVSKAMKRYYILIHQSLNTPDFGDFELTIQTNSYTQHDFETCDGSMDLIPGSSVAIEQLRYDSLQVGQGFAIMCNDAMLHASSPRIWYKVHGTGNVMTASTCDPLTTFDTQVTILLASSTDTTNGNNGCDALQCVAGNDQQSCGDKAVVTWPTKVNEVYYVVVHGFGSRVGTFGLRLKEDE